jgi:hypothetical protein
VQINNEGFHKRAKYHCSILPGDSRYRYLYFSIGKQWSKDLLSNEGISISQHTSIARARGKCNDKNLCIMTLRG